MTQGIDIEYRTTVIVDTTHTHTLCHPDTDSILYKCTYTTHTYMSIKTDTKMISNILSCELMHKGLIHAAPN